MLRLIEPLGFYAERYGAPVDKAIVSTLALPIGKAQLGMDAFTASRLSSVIDAALLRSCPSPRPRRRVTTPGRPVPWA